MKQITAKLKYLNIAPRKTRFVADTIRGLSVNEAEAQLMFAARRSGTPLLKLLRSASANAKNNHKVDPAKLYVKEIRVDEGPVGKRYMPRAFGRVNLIEKKTSHVTLVLGVSEKPQEQKFVIAPKPKKEKAETSKKSKKAEKSSDTAPSHLAHGQAADKEKPEIDKKASAPDAKKVGGKKPGFFRRTFRRKSV